MKLKSLFPQYIVSVFGVATAAVLLTTALPTFADNAQTSGCKGWHHSSGMGEHGGFPMGMQTRLDKLKIELKLQPAQQSAWQAFESTVSAQRDKMKARHDQMKTDASQPLPDRLDKHLAMMKEREADMQDMFAAIKTLYAALTPDQQAIMDKHFSHRHPSPRQGQRQGRPQG